MVPGLVDGQRSEALATAKHSTHIAGEHSHGKNQLRRDEEQPEVRHRNSLLWPKCSSYIID